MVENSSVLFFLAFKLYRIEFEDDGYLGEVLQVNAFYRLYFRFLNNVSNLHINFNIHIHHHLIGVILEFSKDSNLLCITSRRKNTFLIEMKEF